MGSHPRKKDSERRSEEDRQRRRHHSGAHHISDTASNTGSTWSNAGSFPSSDSMPYSDNQQNVDAPSDSRPHRRRRHRPDPANAIWQQQQGQQPSHQQSQYPNYTVNPGQQYDTSQVNYIQYADSEGNNHPQALQNDRLAMHLSTSPPWNHHHHHYYGNNGDNHSSHDYNQDQNQNQNQDYGYNYSYPYGSTMEEDEDEQGQGDQWDAAGGQ